MTMVGDLISRLLIARKVSVQNQSDQAHTGACTDVLTSLTLAVVRRRFAVVCRYDVLLTANHPSRTYFITVASQFRPGAPNGYGFLQYSNATAGGLPSTPTVQENATLPWNQSQIDKACSLQRVRC